MLKTCRSCNKEKEITDFYEKKDDGKRYCKSCCSIKEKQAREKQYEIICASCGEETLCSKDIKGICTPCYRNIKMKQIELREEKRKDSMINCNKCNIVKPASEYYKNRITCKECVCTNQREKNKIIIKTKIKPEFIICNTCGQKTSRFRLNRKKCEDCAYKTLSRSEQHVETRRHRSAAYGIYHQKQKKSKSFDCEQTIFRDWIQYQFKSDIDYTKETWEFDHVIPCSLYCSDKYPKEAVLTWMNIQPCLKREHEKKATNLDLETCKQHMVKIQNFCLEKNITFGVYVRYLTNIVYDLERNKTARQA